MSRGCCQRGIARRNATSAREQEKKKARGSGNNSEKGESTLSFPPSLFYSLARLQPHTLFLQRTRVLAHVYTLILFTLASLARAIFPDKLVARERTTRERDYEDEEVRGSTLLSVINRAPTFPAFSLFSQSRSKHNCHLKT